MEAESVVVPAEAMEDMTEVGLAAVGLVEAAMVEDMVGQTGEMMV